MKPTHSTIVAELHEQYPGVHPSTLHLVPYFAYDHLPPDLAEISQPFHDLAHNLVAQLDSDASHTGVEAAVALRKLLEAKDAAVRAFV